MRVLVPIKATAESEAGVMRSPNPMPGSSEIEIRPIFEYEDFGEQMTPELREQEEQMREELEGR